MECGINGRMMSEDDNVWSSFNTTILQKICLSEGLRLQWTALMVLGDRGRCQRVPPFTRPTGVDGGIFFFFFFLKY